MILKTKIMIFAQCHLQLNVSLLLKLITKPFFSGYLSLFEDSLQQCNTYSAFMWIWDCQDKFTLAHK